MPLDPNIILAAGKASGGIDPAQLLQAANQIKLGQLGIQDHQRATDLAAQNQAKANDAIGRLSQNPNDLVALRDLTLADPTSGETVRKTMLRQRLATQARTLPGGSMAGDAVPLNAVGAAPVPAAPVAAPAAQPGSGPLTLPGTGATINIPADPSAQQPPAAAPVPADPQAAPGDHPLVAKSIAATTPGAQIVGSQLASGKLTPQEAAAQVLEVGDPKDIAETTAAIKGLNDSELADYNQKNKAMADAVSSIRGIPDDATHSARMAALMAKAPELAQIGITPQMLVHADLSDRGINGTVGQAAGYQGMFDNELKLREAAQKDATIAETNRHNVAGEQSDKTHVVGGALVNDEGKVLFDSNGSQNEGDINSRIAAVEGTARNPASSAIGPGQFVNSTFRQFIAGVSPETARKISGMNDSQLTAYRAANASTLAPLQQQMISNLTASNQSALTSAGLEATDGNTYLAHVFGAGGAVQALKGNPNTPAAAYLGGGKALSNNGLNPNSTVAQVQAWADKKMASAGGSSRFEGQAQAIVRGDAPPLTGRAAVTGAGGQIMQRVYQINPQFDGKNYAGEAAAVKAFGVGKQGDATRSFSVAIDHMDTLSKAAAALQNGNTRVFNSFGQAYASQTGSAAPTNFDAVKAAVSTEIAKAIGGGHLTDASVAGIEAGIKNSSSPAQLNGYVNQMKELLAGQLSGYHRQYTASTKRTGERDDYSSTFLSAPAAALMAAHERASDGGGSSPPARAVAYLKANPNMRAAFDQKYGAGASSGILGR